MYVLYLAPAALDTWLLREKLCCEVQEPDFHHPPDIPIFLHTRKIQECVVGNETNPL